MKLKLEEKDDQSLLLVTDALTERDAAVLKAGVIKLISGKKRTSLDFTGLSTADPQALVGLRALPELASESGADLEIIPPGESAWAAARQKNASLAERIARLEDLLHELRTSHRPEASAGPSSACTEDQRLKRTLEVAKRALASQGVRRAD